MLDLVVQCQFLCQFLCLVVLDLVVQCQVVQCQVVQCQVLLDLVVLDLVVLDLGVFLPRVVAQVRQVVLLAQVVPQPLVAQSQVVWANLVQAVKVVVLEQAVLGLQAFERHQ